MTDIGICLGTEEIAESARDAERLGFESVWARDHFTGRYPAMLAPEVVLATAAAVTEHLRVGYGVLLAPCPAAPPAGEGAGLAPVRLAGAAAGGRRGRTGRVGALARRSAGRARVGGAGRTPWEAEARTERALRLLPGLVGGEPTAIVPEGQADAAGAEGAAGIGGTLTPAVPVPPLFVAGGPRESVLRRAVAFGAGWFPAVISPAQLADGVRRLRRYADDAGRPAPPVTVAVPVQLGIPGEEVAAARDAMARLAAFVAAGADRIVLSGGSSDGWRTSHELLARTTAVLNT